MPQGINRRELLVGAGAVAATTALGGCQRTEPERPAGVPISPFDAESTAEEVTEGLDLSGKTALVTGVTSGLGYETMRVLALRGAHVLGTGRTLDRAAMACASVDGLATPLELELSDFDSVVRCARTVREAGLPLDMLICNAGIMELPEPRQVYGIEMQFVVNHLGHFLLTNRLLAELMAAPQGRVVVVGSGAYKDAPEAGIEFDNLSGERDYEPRRAYGQSKLANYLFVREFARRVADTPITANACQPGVILTELGRHLPAWRQFLARMIGWTFMRSVEAGAATQTYLATHPDLAETSGYFFRDSNPILPGGNMENDELAAQLWEVSEELTRDWLKA